MPSLRPFCAVLVAVVAGLLLLPAGAHAQIPFPGFEEKGPELRFAGQDELLDRIDRFVERVDKRIAERSAAGKVLLDEYQARLEPMAVVPEVTPLIQESAAVREANALRAEFSEIKEMLSRERRLLESARTMTRRAREAASGKPRPLAEPVELDPLLELELRARRLRTRLAQEESAAERLEALADAEASVPPVGEDVREYLERALHQGQSFQSRARALETRATARSLTQQSQQSLPSLALTPADVNALQKLANEAQATYEKGKTEAASERRKLRDLISDGRRNAEADHKLGLALLVRVDRQLELLRAEAGLAGTKAWGAKVMTGVVPYQASKTSERRRNTAAHKARLEAGWSELEQAVVDSKKAEASAQPNGPEFRRTQALEDAVAAHLEARQRLEAADVMVDLLDTQQQIPVSGEDRWRALAWTALVALVALFLIVLGLRLFSRVLSLEAPKKRLIKMSDRAAGRWSTGLTLLWPLLITAGAAAVVVWSIWRLDVGVGQALGAVNRPLFYVEDEGVSALSVVKLLVTLWVAVVVSRTTRQLLSSRVFPSFDFDSGLTNAINTMVHYVVVILGLVIGLRFVGVGLSSLAIFAGILGIGIGFGLRNITENFISGLIILAERPVKIGDFIHLDNNVEGRVDSIRARSTTVVTRDNISVIIPNSEFVSKPVVNWSHGDNRVRIPVEVGVAYGSNTNLTRKTLLEVATQHGQVLKKPRPEVQFKGFGASSLDFALLVWIEEQTHRFRIASDLHFSIDAAFRRNQIEVAFPQMDLHFKSLGAQLQGVLAPLLPPEPEEEEWHVEPAPIPEAGRRLPPRSETALSRLPQIRGGSKANEPATEDVEPVAETADVAPSKTKDVAPAKTKDVVPAKTKGTAPARSKAKRKTKAKPKPKGD